MDVSDILFLFLLGEGKGRSEVQGGGGESIFLIANSRRVFRRGRGRGAGRVSAANWGNFFGGGGA